MSDHGRTWGGLLRATASGVVIVAPCLVFAAGLGCPPWVLLLLSPACLVFPAGAALMACFRVRVRGAHVESVFLGRFVALRRRLSRFAYVDDVLSVIIFEDGKRLHVTEALSSDEWERLEVELAALSVTAKAAE